MAGIKVRMCSNIISEVTLHFSAMDTQYMKNSNCQNAFKRKPHQIVANEKNAMIFVGFNVNNTHKAFILVQFICDSKISKHKCVYQNQCSL